MQMKMNKIQDNGIIVASPPCRPSRRVPVHVLTKHRENGTQMHKNSTRPRQHMSSIHDPIVEKLHRAIVHVTLNEISVGFALECIYRTMKVEIAKALIISGDFWRFGGGPGLYLWLYTIVFNRDFCTIGECSPTLGNSFH
jgi:hypothetical protein